MAPCCHAHSIKCTHTQHQQLEGLLCLVCALSGRLHDCHRPIHIQELQGTSIFAHLQSQRLRAAAVDRPEGLQAPGTSQGFQTPRGSA